jgi:two-component system NtrC family sensor kinase
MKETFPDAMRVLVTAYADQQPIVEAINKIEITRYIPKPWDAREMAALCASAIELYVMRDRMQTLETQLMTSQRADVLGRLAAGLVHDMASPLAAITANVERMRYGDRYYAEALERLGSKKDDVTDMLRELPELGKDLDMSTQYLTQLVEGIREHWRPASVDGECDPVAVAEFSRRLVQAKVRNEKVSLKIDAPEVGKVRVAPSVLCQVVTNLLTNATQAFDEKSVKREVSLTLQRDGDGVAITVADTGKGIPPDVLERLGTEQLTTKAVGQGTGLGVMVCRQMVERLGGKFSLKSTVGAGTTARVWVPSKK